MASSARYTVKYLQEAGHDVRVLAGPNPDPNGPQPEFLLKEYIFPLAQPIVEALGYHYAASVQSLFCCSMSYAERDGPVAPLPHRHPSGGHL
jgi:hypothetical protein